MHTISNQTLFLQKLQDIVQFDLERVIYNAAILKAVDIYPILGGHPTTRYSMQLIVVVIIFWALLLLAQ